MKLKDAREKIADAQDRGLEAAQNARESIARSTEAAKAQLEPLGDVARRSAEQLQAAGTATRERVAGMSRPQKAASLVAAGAAASFAAWWMFRRQSESGDTSQLRLEPTTSGRWRVVSDDFDLDQLTGDDRVFETKSEGLRVARALARDLADGENGSELVVHLADGEVQDRHRYSA